MEKEIEVILDQFRVLAEQKEQIDNELKPLNAETRALRDQISAFDGRAQEANVCVHPSPAFPPKSLLILLGFHPERGHGRSRGPCAGTGQSEALDREAEGGKRQGRGSTRAGEIGAARV